MYSLLSQQCYYVELQAVDSEYESVSVNPGDQNSTYSVIVSVKLK